METVPYGHVIFFDFGSHFESQQIQFTNSQHHKTLNFKTVAYSRFWSNGITH